MQTSPCYAIMDDTDDTTLEQHFTNQYKNVGNEDTAKAIRTYHYHKRMNWI